MKCSEMKLNILCFDFNKEGTLKTHFMYTENFNPFKMTRMQCIFKLQVVKFNKLLVLVVSYINNKENLQISNIIKSLSKCGSVKIVSSKQKLIRFSPTSRSSIIAKVSSGSQTFRTCVSYISDCFPLHTTRVFFSSSLVDQVCKICPVNILANAPNHGRQWFSSKTRG